MIRYAPLVLTLVSLSLAGQASADLVQDVVAVGSVAVYYCPNPLANGNGASLVLETLDVCAQVNFVGLQGGYLVWLTTVCTSTSCWLENPCTDSVAPVEVLQQHVCSVDISHLFQICAVLEDAAGVPIASDCI